MYVCICNAVTDRAIREHAEAGVTTLRELRAATGCAGTCGQCARHAREILSSACRPGADGEASSSGLPPFIAAFA